MVASLRFTVCRAAREGSHRLFVQPLKRVGLVDIPPFLSLAMCSERNAAKQDTSFPIPLPRLLLKLRKSLKKV